MISYIWQLFYAKRYLFTFHINSSIHNDSYIAFASSHTDKLPLLYAADVRSLFTVTSEVDVTYQTRSPLKRVTYPPGTIYCFVLSQLLTPLGLKRN